MAGAEPHVNRRESWNVDDGCCRARSTEFRVVSHAAFRIVKKQMVAVLSILHGNGMETWRSVCR